MALRAAAEGAGAHKGETASSLQGFHVVSIAATRAAKASYARLLRDALGWALSGQALRASSSLSVTFVLPLAQRAPGLHPAGPGWPPGPGDNWGPGRVPGGPLPLFDVAAAAPEPVTLTLASFAVTKLAYVRLTKQFREQYLKEKGVDVRFRLTFAGSGVQARAVIDGLPAELVALALPLDVDRISAAGLIIPSWRARYPCKSTVCETTVALVVRPGNPKNITDWADLTRPGVEVVLANPKTAGVARWIFLALWGSQQSGWRRKINNQQALDYVRAVFANVVVQPRDAREASDVFYKQKIGDVLLTYENEVVLTNAVYGDKALPYVVPRTNVRIECPISPVDAVLQTRPAMVQVAADDFVKFLFTTLAQREFAKLGFRVNPQVSRTAAEQQVGLPATRLWSVDDVFGGWAKAQARFFDAGCVLDQIQEEVGRRRVEQRRVAQAKK